MKRNTFLLAFLSLFIASNVWGGAMIYKCKNHEGAYIYQKSACGDTADTLGFWVPKEAPILDSTSGNEKGVDKATPVVLSLKQHPSGHYFTEGSINDKSLNFVVDTGASFVSLPESLAHGALIYCDAKISINTANGIADSCTTKIKTLKFGPFTMQDVTAIIQPNLGQPLLGMNVLQQFKLQQNGGEMQISIHEKSKDGKDETN